MSHSSYMKCSVVTCYKYFNPKPEFEGKSYISYPAGNPERIQIWQQVVGRTDISAKICSDHFVRFRVREPKPSTPRQDPLSMSGGLKREKDANAIDEMTVPVIASVSSITSEGLHLVNVFSNDSKVALSVSNSPVPSTSLIVSSNSCVGETSDGRGSNSDNPEKGLIIIPASVKPPPLKSNLSQSVNYALDDSRLVIPVVGDILEPINDVSRRPLNGDDTKYENSKKMRKRRSTKEEMLRKEEEDEWAPSFWTKRRMLKGSLDDIAENMNNASNKLTDEAMISPSKSKSAVKRGEHFTSEEGSTDPVFTMDGDVHMESSSRNDKQASCPTNPPVKKRRPGPASKTCRPQYVPDQNSECDERVPSPSPITNKDEARIVDRDESSTTQDACEDVGDKKSSTLVEWCFFKSLIPELRKMNSSKRNELINFILDKLNDAVYNGKPIPRS